MEDKIEILRKLMDKENDRRKKQGDERPAIYIAGEHPELLDQGILRSGNLALDSLLHGGYRRGSCTIFYGPEKAGKTSLALESIANIQKEGGICAYIHSESAFPSKHAELLGVDLSKLIMIQDFNNGEAAFDILRDLLIDDKYLPRNLIDFVVVDSVAALASRAELNKMQEEGMAADTMGAHPKMMTKITKLLFNTGAIGRAAVLLINQVRDNLSYGGGTYMPGGRALRHAAHVIVYVTAPNGEDFILFEGTGSDRKRVGHTVKLTVKKNKAGLGGHEGEETTYTVRYNEGSEMEQPLIDLAVERGVIEEPSKGWFILNVDESILSDLGLVRPIIDKKTGEISGYDKVKVQGRKNLISLLKENKNLNADILKRLGIGSNLDEEREKLMVG